MAFNKAPTTIWPGYSSNGTDITIPIAALDGLTAAEAHATTGDWRSIMLSLASTLYRYYYELPTADRPLAVVVHAPTLYPVASGSLAGSYKTTYRADYYNDLETPNVVDEPV